MLQHVNQENTKGKQSRQRQSKDANSREVSLLCRLQRQDSQVLDFSLQQFQDYRTVALYR